MTDSHSNTSPDPPKNNSGGNGPPGKILKSSSPFPAPLGPGKIRIKIRIHDGSIVKIIRAHKTNFNVEGKTIQPDVDRLNIDLRKRLNQLIESYGIQYGKMTIHLNDGDVTLIRPAHGIRPADFPGLLKRLFEMGGPDTVTGFH